ncbi:MAG TPA: hypothetical protein VHB21_21730 [Minicystis sp.]|nr:hypothetical protein [Minicystis sp.]
MAERGPRKKAKRKPASKPPSPPPVAERPPSNARVVALTALGAAFLALVFMDAAGWDQLTLRVPRPLHYFAQIATLFPRADGATTEYHAEAWVCRDRRWVEVAVEPFFPIDAGEKENRFARILHFYPRDARDRPVMNALDDFLVDHLNERAREIAARGGGPGAELVGGVRFSRLSIPIPALGAPVARYARHPLADSPPAWKHDKYWTRLSKRRERCTAFDPDYDDKDVDEGRATPHGATREAPAPDEAAP